MSQRSDRRRRDPIITAKSPLASTTCQGIRFLFGIGAEWNREVERWINHLPADSRDAAMRPLT